MTAALDRTGIDISPAITPPERTISKIGSLFAPPESTFRFSVLSNNVTLKVCFKEACPDIPSM